MIIETCPKCGARLMSLMLTSNPPIPQMQCTKCNWSWTGKPEKIEYKPFVPPKDTEETTINLHFSTSELKLEEKV